MTTRIPTRTTGRVIGEALRRLRLRDRQTQPEAATHLQRHGLPWTRDALAAIEGGRREDITLRELLLLADAYAVTLPDLFKGNAAIDLAPERRILGVQLRAALSGERVRLTGSGASARRMRGQMPPDDAADRAVAQRLALPLAEVQETAHGLWHRTVGEERDRRLGDLSDKEPRSRSARRAAMTRTLTREIEEARR